MAKTKQNQSDFNPCYWLLLCQVINGILIRISDD